jgi:hypothetical protein
MVAYLHEMTDRTEKRRRLSRKMLEFVKNYLKSLDKSFNEWIKDTLASFEKMRRKIGETFGTRWIAFYKIISLIFENYLENTGRLMLRTNLIIQKI